MKIVMYNDDFGGPTTTFIHNDLVSLAKKHEVKYICSKLNSKGTFIFNDLHVIPFERNRLAKKIYWILEINGWYLSLRNSSFAKAANAILDKFKPDLIQCNFGIEALTLADNLSHENRRIPFVINFLGYDASFHLKRASYVRKLKELAARPNVFATCNALFLKKNLEEKGVYFKENRVIHTGVSLDYFDRQNKYPFHPEYVYLQIATLSYRKGQEVALRAFDLMLKTVSLEDKLKYRLVLAGGDENGYAAVLNALVDKLGLANYVSFTGWITPEQSKELMMNADCFIHHSRTTNGRTEGIPTAISEAMAMELPVISTRHAGIPELVEEGVNGYLVDENDVVDFAKRMNDIRGFGFKRANRQKVHDLFNIAKRTGELEAYYEFILKGK